MALATKCPHCHTTFRVAHDQLKLRAGLVRCGSCKQIFNGIENLLRPDEAERVAPPAPAPAPAPAPVSVSARPEPAPSRWEPSSESNAPAEAEQPEPHETTPTEEHRSEPAMNADAPGSENTDDDPLQRMTLLDFSDTEQNLAAKMAAESAAQFEHSDELDALDKAIDDLQHQPWHGTVQPIDEASETDETDQEEHRAAGEATPELAEQAQTADVSDAAESEQAESRPYEEPSFVRQGRRRQRLGRFMRILMSIGLPLLLLVMLAQGVYIFRNQLAAWFPQAKPGLQTACAMIGCQVGLPAQIDAVSIESSELQTAGADEHTFSLSVLLSNHSSIAQAWPSIELTLNDADDKPIARRVFTARDYLPTAQDINKGFAPKSEQTIKLYFELSQLKASGYRVYLFYP